MVGHRVQHRSGRGAPFTRVDGIAQGQTSNTVCSATNTKFVRVLGCTCCCGDQSLGR